MRNQIAAQTDPPFDNKNEIDQLRRQVENFSSFLIQKKKKRRQVENLRQQLKKLENLDHEVKIS